MQIAAASRGQNKPTAGFQSYLKKKIFTSKDACDQQENLLGKTQRTLTKKDQTKGKLASIKAKFTRPSKRKRSSSLSKLGKGDAQAVKDGIPSADQSDIERLADLKMSNPLFVRARRQDGTSSGTTGTRAVNMAEEDFSPRKHSRSFR